MNTGLEVQSAIPGAVWPALPASPGSAVLAVLFQLEQAQWLAPEAIQALQFRQLQALLRHAFATVPYYRERWAGAFDVTEPLAPERFAALPRLARGDLQDHYEALKTTALPASHGAPHESRTSGSTGAAVRVLKTPLTHLYWRAFTLRDHCWHRRDFHARLATIRHGIESGEHANWGAATAGVVETGPVALLHIGADVDAQLAWLARQRPQYLMTYPSNAAELAMSALAKGVELPGLREVRTLGEVLAPEVRALCREAWDVSVTDIYSADEIGYLALQCPGHEHYHVQSEGVLLEVLDEEGRPCPPGTPGRVVVTDLHNFATPLVRYELGDYVEAGDACPCGRGLPVLKRIMGRTRNMLVAPDGKRYWPFFGTRGFAEIAPVLQQQFVQTSPDVVEARLVTASPLTADQEQRLRQHIEARLPAGIQVRITPCAEIRRSAGGKFEDFICEVTPPQR